MLALQSIIIGDLRAMGCFVLGGIVRFTRNEVKARPAEARLRRTAFCTLIFVMLRLRLSLTRDDREYRDW